MSNQVNLPELKDEAVRQAPLHQWRVVLLSIVLLSACTHIDTKKKSTRSGSSAIGIVVGSCWPIPDNPVTVIEGRQPIYPVKRLLKVEEGFARFKFDITAEGRTENFEHLESSHPAFYAHSKIAIADWEFAPVLVDGTPTRVTCHQRLEFGLLHKPPGTRR